MVLLSVRCSTWMTCQFLYSGMYSIPFGEGATLVLVWQNCRQRKKAGRHHIMILFMKIKLYGAGEPQKDGTPDSDESGGGIDIMLV